MRDSIIEIKAKSLVSFYQACGKTISYDEARLEVLETIERNKPRYNDNTWVDITTGKRIKGQF